MIRLEVAGAVAVATLQRPPLNAIDEAWVERLREVIREARQARVLLVRSGEKAFSAGAAKLGLPEASLGLLPGAGGTQRLTHLCGEATAKRLILGAEVVDGAEAARLGVVQWAVPQEALAARAMQLAQDLAALPADGLTACKRCIAAVDGNGYELELEATGTLLASAETQARVRAFLEKRR